MVLGKLFARADSTPTEHGEDLEGAIGDAKADPNSIGNLAVELNYCTADDIEEALNVQRERLQLGQILVDLGKLTEEQRADILIEQRIRKGEKVNAVELRKHERMKLRSRINGMADGFREAGKEARGLAMHVGDVMKATG